MQMKIKGSADLEKLMESLSNDLIYANVFYRLHRDLVGSIEQYEREYNQSPTFWKLTFHAHWDACLVRLCRAFDQHRTGLHLRKWLEVIQENIHLFETDAFKERLKGNPFVDSLAKHARKPDPEQLASDIEFATDKNPLVHKLTVLRHNVLAHSNMKAILRDQNLWQEQSLRQSEVSTLLGRAMEILNRYSNLFAALSYSRSIIGEGDYKNVLTSVQRDLERYRAERDDERRRFQESPDPS